jgi:hypothetical protein
MRFHFEVPNGPVPITIEDRRLNEGSTDQVFELRSEDAGKRLTLWLDGREIRGRLDVFEHTQLTRISVVPVRIPPEAGAALRAGMAVSLVVYERPRDARMSEATTEMRTHHGSDREARERLLADARAAGHVIALLELRAVRRA